MGLNISAHLTPLDTIQGSNKDSNYKANRAVILTNLVRIAIFE